MEKYIKHVAKQSDLLLSVNFNHKVPLQSIVFPGEDAVDDILLVILKIFVSIEIFNWRSKVQLYSVVGYKQFVQIEGQVCRWGDFHSLKR